MNIFCIDEDGVQQRPPKITFYAAFDEDGKLISTPLSRSALEELYFNQIYYVERLVNQDIPF